MARALIGYGFSILKGGDEEEVLSYYLRERGIILNFDEEDMEGAFLDSGLNLDILLWRSGRERGWLIGIKDSVWDRELGEYLDSQIELPCEVFDDHFLTEINELGEVIGREPSWVLLCSEE